jgi:hypothetical protein
LLPWEAGALPSGLLVTGAKHRKINAVRNYSSLAKAAREDGAFSSFDEPARRGRYEQ